MFGAIAGKIFGTDKALTAVVEGVSSGLDKLIYTSEEKADDASKERAAARMMVIEWMAATKGQNIARRLIALSIVFTWLSQYISMCLLSVVAVWLDKEVADKMIESANVIGGFADKMNGAVMLILGFYFCAPYMGKMVDGAMKKFSGIKS